MPRRHYVGTSRGGPIVATRDAIVECGQVLGENRWIAWLHVDREEEEEEEKEKEEEEEEEEEKEKGIEIEIEKNDDKRHRRERIANSQTERPPRGFLSHGRG